MRGSNSFYITYADVNCGAHFFSPCAQILQTRTSRCKQAKKPKQKKTKQKTARAKKFPCVYIKLNGTSTSSCFKQAMTEGLGHITHPGVYVWNLDVKIQAVQKLVYYKITTLLTWRSCTELHLLSTFLSSAFRRKSLNSGDLLKNKHKTVNLLAK